MKYYVKQSHLIPVTAETKLRYYGFKKMLKSMSKRDIKKCCKEYPDFNSKIIQYGRKYLKEKDYQIIALY